MAFADKHWDSELVLAQEGLLLLQHCILKKATHMLHSSTIPGCAKVMLDDEPVSAGEKLQHQLWGKMEKLALDGWCTQLLQWRPLYIVSLCPSCEHYLKIDCKKGSFPLRNYESLATTQWQVCRLAPLYQHDNRDSNSDCAAGKENEGQTLVNTQYGVNERSIYV